MGIQLIKTILLMSGFALTVATEVMDQEALLTQPDETGFGYVVNGHQVKWGTRPYMASLVMNVENGMQFQCGGTVLDKTHILTAAHCVSHPASLPSPLKSVIVRVRVYTINPLDSSAISFTVSPSNIKIHENFNKHQYLANDIAIINLDSPIDFVDKFCPDKKRKRKHYTKHCLQVNPVDIAKASTILDKGTVAWGVGWGRNNTDDPDLSPPNMQEVKLQVLTYEELVPKLVAARGPLETANIVKNFLNSTSQIFALQPESICNGDSGGPLMVNNIQIGITSLVDINCKPGLQVFTRVSTYSSWIAQQLAKTV